MSWHLASRHVLLASQGLLTSHHPSPSTELVHLSVISGEEPDKYPVWEAGSQDLCVGVRVGYRGGGHS